MPQALTHTPGCASPYLMCRCPAGYSAAVIYVVIAMLLYNVQQDIEQPFDMEVGHATCLLHNICDRVAYCCLHGPVGAQRCGGCSDNAPGN
jgi:hypothetical protein